MQGFFVSNFFFFLVGRYNYFDFRIPQTSAQPMCKSLFADASVLEFTSEKEYQAFSKYAAEEGITAEIIIGDDTSPADRGIGEDVVFKPGESRERSV